MTNLVYIYVYIYIHANDNVAEEQQWYYLMHRWGYKGVHTFPKDILIYQLLRSGRIWHKVNF